MKYRTTTLLATKELTGAGTEIIPINVKDIVSRITMVWSIGKLALGQDSYCHKDITKIELVDGSDVLFGMDGGQAQALNIYDRKCPTCIEGTVIDANEVRSFYSIDFGRWLYDTELALDPSRFNNLQLRITYDSDVMEVGCESGDLAVYADLFDEKVISPIGFLMSKEHYHSVMGATDAYTYISLPLDHVYRKMLVQGYRAKQHPQLQVAEARLDEDNEARIPFNWDLGEYHRLRRAIDQPVQEHIASQGQPAGTDLFCTPSDYWATLVAIVDGIGRTITVGNTHAGGYFHVTTNVDTAYQAIVKGWLPNHCFQFPFGDQKDIDDWYDVTKLGHLRLRLRAGTYNEAGEQAVVLQQLRRY